MTLVIKLKYKIRTVGISEKGLNQKNVIGTARQSYMFYADNKPTSGFNNP
jgi:hypothetical protein